MHPPVDAPPIDARVCPRSEVTEGYIFTGVCHSLCPQIGKGVVTSNASWDRVHHG